MARTVLLIILLDTLTDVPSILNKTLHEHFKQYANATIELNQQCDPALADFVLNKAKYDGENNKTNDAKPAANMIELADSLYEDSVLDNYTPELKDVNSLENNLIDLTDGRRDNKEFSDYIMANPSGTFIGDVVEDAPFLVAIFETVANVTAQTCAGALLASRWVLTAASCVNVLGNLNGNKTNSSEGSTYTVVAGASNPFMDGTMHNVTKIILSDDKITNDGLRMDFERELKRTFHLLPELGPTLAMMRIEPGVVAEAVEVWEGEAKGLNVTVYGWTLLRHDSYDAVRATSRSAVVSAPWMFHNVSTSALYLSMNTSLGYHSQMGSGGPVLVRGRRARMLGVLLEDHAPMIAEPLRRHAPWIQRVLNNDV